MIYICFAHCSAHCFAHRSACHACRLSQLVETAVDELVVLLKSPLSDDELKKMMPEPDNSQQAPEPDAYTQVLNQFTQRNTEALVRCKYYILSWTIFI